ncbi:hypothetical protein G6F22_017428 [Rhizopus arrhizus]|nr:hypothetical protein G6F22_017428 [Rhizopus arrhizus]
MRNSASRRLQRIQVVFGERRAQRDLVAFGQRAALESAEAAAQVGRFAAHDGGQRKAAVHRQIAARAHGRAGAEGEGIARVGHQRAVYRDVLAIEGRAHVGARQRAACGRVKTQRGADQGHFQRGRVGGVARQGVGQAVRARRGRGPGSWTACRA